jgi:mono/diheme cytochrome c family protein
MRKIALVLVFGGILGFFIPDSHAQRGDAANGATLYSQNCTTCHGASGEGVSGPSLIGCSLCSSLLSLYEKINAEMPQNNPDACIAWHNAVRSRGA